MLGSVADDMRAVSPATSPLLLSMSGRAARWVLKSARRYPLPAAIAGAALLGMGVWLYRRQRSAVRSEGG